MPQRYTVRDDRGRTITFDWDDPNPPTDADMEEVFAAAGQESTASPEEAPTKPEKSISGFLGNVLSSGANLVKDTLVGGYDAAKGLGTVAQGMRGDPEAIGKITAFAREVPGALAQIPGLLKDRYGSLDALGNTLYEDPVGVASDVSMLAGVGGATLPGRAGRITARVSSATNPLNAVVTAAGVGQPLGRALMQKALKPSQAVTGGKPENVAKIVETALEEGLSPTRRGYIKADDLVGKLDEQVIPQVQEAARLGVNIDPAAMANVDRAKKTFMGVDPDADLRRIDNVRTRFLARNPNPIPIDEAFEMARKEGQILHKKFGETKAAGVEAKKDIRHNLRNEIRDVMDQADFDIAPLMDREARILQAMPAIADRARVGGNLNPFGLAPLAHSPMGAAAFLMDRAPAVVGGAARGAYQVGRLDNPATRLLTEQLLRAALLARLKADVGGPSR